MTKHKTEDYKISAVKYYLNHDRLFEKRCKIYNEINKPLYFF